MTFSLEITTKQSFSFIKIASLQLNLLKFYIFYCKTFINFCILLKFAQNINN